MTMIKLKAFWEAINDPTTIQFDFHATMSFLSYWAGIVIISAIIVFAAKGIFDYVFGEE